MEINKKIKTLRKEKGVTQRRLGELTGIAAITIQQYEAGKYKPKIEAIWKIADALGVTLDAFIEIEGFPKNRDEAEEYKDGLLLECFHKLNKEGKIKAVEALEDLTYIPKYTEPDTD